MLYYERKLKKSGTGLVIGVDEAGRGPLAGPVVAAAVVLRKERFSNRIDDSKKLTSLQREKAYPEIIQKTDYGIGIIDEGVIDEINIHRATIMAMEKAVNSLLEKLKQPAKRAHIIVDGKVRLDLGLPCTAIIKGDGRSRSIASASILAKVTRDRLMLNFDRLYPEYGFRVHKGYPTKAHKKALAKFGPCPIHRKSFEPVRENISRGIGNVKS